MVFKINVSDKSGKTYKVELEADVLVGKSLHDRIPGNSIIPDLAGYELEITGASDKAGFTAIKNVEGIGLKKVLLSYEKGMKKRPKKEGKIKRAKNRPRGLKLRKTVRGRTISPAIAQINLRVVKEGGKKLSDVFPDQNKAPEPKEAKTDNTQKKAEPAVKEKGKKENAQKQSKEKTAEGDTELPKKESSE